MSTRLNDIANEIDNLAHEVSKTPEIEGVAVSLYESAASIRRADKRDDAFHDEVVARECPRLTALQGRGFPGEHHTFVSSIRNDDTCAICAGHHSDGVHKLGSGPPQRPRNRLPKSGTKY